MNGVELQYCIAEVVYVKVCVNLRRGDALMSQHFLYSAQISTTLYQVGGKRMAESVWANHLIQSGKGRIVFYHVEDAYAR